MMRMKQDSEKKEKKKNINDFAITISAWPVNASWLITNGRERNGTYFKSYTTLTVQRALF